MPTTESIIQPFPAIGGRKTAVEVTITSSTGRKTAPIKLDGYSICSINMSTGWTKAPLTFLGSPNTTNNMNPIRHTTAGVLLAYVTTGNRLLAVDPYIFSGLRYIQLASSTATQATTRNITLGLAPVNPIK